MSEPVILTRPDGVLALREPALPPPHRLLVLIHGWGGNEHSLWEFTKGIPADYRVIAPRGTYFKAEGEYGWRPTILGRRSRLEENLEPAHDLLARIDTWASLSHVDASKFSLTGVLARRSPGLRPGASLPKTPVTRDRAVGLSPPRIGPVRGELEEYPLPDLARHPGRHHRHRGGTQSPADAGRSRRTGDLDRRGYSPHTRSDHTRSHPGFLKINSPRLSRGESFHLYDLSGPGKATTNPG